MALKVVRNEVDGWDVVREDEDVALSNHPDRATRRRPHSCAPTRSTSASPAASPWSWPPDEVHAIDDTREGMKPAFLYLGGLLALITILVIVLALTGSLTGFGS